MNRKAVISVVVITIVVFQTGGRLIIAPRDIESKVGDATYFNCTTDLDSGNISWYHGDKSIYTEGVIHESYDKRFTIDDIATKGLRNLVITSVEPGDAGEYICVDDGGFGERRSAQLIVLDSGPECQSNMKPDGVIGQNVFNITPDEVQLTCIVTFHGNIPPQMKWMRVGDNYSLVEDNITSNIASNNYRLIYTLKLKGDIALDNSSYVCQTTRSTQNQYQCNSETIRVLYYFGSNVTELSVIKGDSLTCPSDRNSFLCVNLWYHKEDSHPSHCDQSFTPRVMGEYICKVKCHIRGLEYTFDALKADVLLASITPESAGYALTLTVIVLMSFKMFYDLDKAQYTSITYPSKTVFYEDIHANVVIPFITVSNVAVAVFVLITASVQDPARITAEWFYQSVIVVTINSFYQFFALGLLYLLTKLLRRRNTVDTRKIAYDFKETPIESLLARKVFVRTDEAELTDDKLVEEEVELLHKIKTGETVEEKVITGVAILAGHLFVAREQTSYLEVYDCLNFNYGPELLKSEQLVSAVDICSCMINNCLYIMDKKRVGVLKEVLKIKRNGDRIKSFNIKNNDFGFLSVTAEGNIVVTVNDKHVLHEHSCHGAWLRTLKFPGCNYPWHAIKTNKESFIVSHGTILDTTHRVCRVDNKMVKKSFGRGIGPGGNQLNIPYYLAVGDEGGVIVADLCNHRLLLLDSNLEFKAKIAPKYKQGFLCPRRVCLDEKLGLLVVVVGAGDPQKVLPKDVGCPGEEEKENVETLIENSSSPRKADDLKLRMNGCHKIKIPEEKESASTEALKDEISTENSISLKEIEERKVKENGYLKKIDLEEGVRFGEDAADGENNNLLREAEAEATKVNGYHKNTVVDLGGVYNEETKKCDNVTENNILPRMTAKMKMKNVDVSKQIEENCGILVFNIKPLLKKYSF